MFLVTNNLIKILWKFQNFPDGIYGEIKKKTHELCEKMLRVLGVIWKYHGASKT